MEGFCSNDHNTICKPCKEGYYSSEFGMFDRCEACKSCQQGELKIIKHIKNWHEDSETPANEALLFGNPVL